MPAAEDVPRVPQPASLKSPMNEIAVGTRKGYGTLYRKVSNARNLPME
jgi:hypothetical protein